MSARDPLLTPADVVDQCMYSSYAAQRDMGIASERLVRFFDVDRYESMYRAERKVGE